jgi:alpha-tubulin suppressor-like RCC1 family protein
MPSKKALDEDQLRRKQALIEKRAARRAAKATTIINTDKAPPTTTAKSTSVATIKSATTATTSSTTQAQASASTSQCGLYDLPEVAWHAILIYLTAAELGCFMHTSRQAHAWGWEARVAFLASRWQSQSTFSSSMSIIQQQQQQQSPHHGMFSSPGHAEEWLNHVVFASHTSSSLPNTTTAATKKSTLRDSTHFPTTSSFLDYARFVEEALSGGSRNAHPSSIPVPRFVQGRFASASPEHSLCRVGSSSSSSSSSSSASQTQSLTPGGSGVASWGVGRRGQLGHGERQDERSPKSLNLSHMIMSTTSMSAFSPQPSILTPVRIVQVAAGGGLVRVAHSLLLTNTGHVYTFGTGQYGALGHGYLTATAKQLPDVLRPRRVEALRDIPCSMVAAGELHSAVVTADGGDVYTWGDGFCGQLGHGDKRPCVTPKLVTQGGLDEECVANIVCGARHTLAVTDEGEVFSWGLGHYGVLGRSYTPFDYDADAAVEGLGREEDENNGGDGVAAPVAAPVVAPVAVQQVSELLAHLEMLANLSLDDSSNQCIPVLIGSLKGIVMVGASAGHRHSLFLDNQGHLYSCGAGNAGCLGHGDTQSHMFPMRITSFDDDQTRILHMSAGVDMSMAVSTTGDVYAWGRTDGGRIGLGMARGQVLLPRRIQLQRDNDQVGSRIPAVDVECGYVHSLIVGLDGSVHMCGNVGVEEEPDGQTNEEMNGQQDTTSVLAGRPRQIPNFYIWHRSQEKKETVKKERWKKFGKYEVKGRSKMLQGDTN